MKKTFFLFCLIFFSLVLVNNAEAYSSSPDTTFPEVNNDVWSIAVDEDANIAYIGGMFTQIGGENKTYLAAVDLSDNSIINTFPVADNVVTELLLDSDNDILYIGGMFTSIGGDAGANDYLAAISTVDYSLIGVFTPSVTGSGGGAMILNMEINGENLYIGGIYDDIDGEDNCGGLGAVKLSDGSLVNAFQPTIQIDGSGDPGLIMDFSIHNNVIYTVGLFTLAGNGATVTSTLGLAAVNMANGTTFEDFHPLVVPGEFDYLYTEIIDDTLYIGGEFHGNNNIVDLWTGDINSRDYILGIDLTTYTLSSFDPDIAMTPHDDGDTGAFPLIADGDLLYIGGGFESVKSTTRNNFAVIDTTDDSLNSFNPNIVHNHENETGVIGITPADDYLFIYGAFNSGEGYTRDYIAKFDNPDIQFTYTTGSGLESLTSTSTEISLSSASNLDTTVNYTVTGTAAGGGVDYTLVDGTATVTASTTTTTIPFTIINDNIDENTETIIITLSSPSNGSLGTNTIFTYSITDNDTAGITQSATTATVTEDGTTGTYTLVLTSEPTDDVVITVSADSQTSVSPSTLTFTSANWNVAQTVTITAVDDDEDEDDSHSSTISHSVSSSNNNYNGYSLSNITVTVTDNDTSGGGGLPPEANNLPDKPWTVSVNNGDKCTDSKNIKLELTTGGRTKYFVISEDLDFSDKSLILFPNKNEIKPPYILPEPLTISYDYDLSAGYGNKTVYVKYYTAYGKSSEVFSDSIIYTDNLEECLLDNDPGYTLFKYQNNPKVYLLEDGKKRWIKNEYTFNKRGYNWSEIQIIDDSIIYLDGVDLFISQSELNYIFTRFLTIGSAGEEVRQLQTKLKELGYFNYPNITGYYGPITFRAVKLFQKDNDIEQVGFVGPETRSALNNL